MEGTDERTDGRRRAVVHVLVVDGTVGVGGRHTSGQLVLGRRRRRADISKRVARCAPAGVSSSDRDAIDTDDMLFTDGLA